MTKAYKIANKIIEVTSLYEKVHTYCKDYLAEGRPDFTVEMTQADIDYERKRNARTAEIGGRNQLASPDDYLEELAVYRKIAEQMPFYDTFLFHGSCIAVGGADFSGLVKGNKMLGEVLELLKTDTTEEKIVKALRDKYEVPYGVIEKDVHRVIAELKKIGAIDG